MYLRCSDDRCGEKLELHQRALACPRCGELLEVAAGPLMFVPQALKELWWNRRCSRDPRDRSGVWRFREFLPEYAPREIVTMGEGSEHTLKTPRVDSDRLLQRSGDDGRRHRGQVAGRAHSGLRFDR